MADTPSSPHRAVNKNGRDQSQDQHIRDLERDTKQIHKKLDKNDADHSAILIVLEDISSDIKARKLLRGVMMLVAGTLMVALGWFAVTTLQHIWKGEQWGKELEKGIQRNSEELREMRRDHDRHNGQKLFRQE